MPNVRRQNTTTPQQQSTGKRKLKENRYDRFEKNDQSIIVQENPLTI